MVRIDDFSYDRLDYRKSFSSWYRKVDSFVESPGFSNFVDHFVYNYSLTPFAIKQYSKRYLINCFSFFSGSYTVNINRSFLFSLEVQYRLFLTYLMLKSGDDRSQDLRHYDIVIDEIEDFDHESSYFRKIIDCSDLNIGFVATRNVGDLENVLLFPFRTNYSRPVVKDAIQKEKRHGIKTYTEVSNDLSFNAFRLAASLVNNLLYYKTVFSAVRCKYTLAMRDYNSYSIKRNIFANYGGGGIAAVQRSTQHEIPLSCFVDLDIHFSLCGEWSKNVLQSYGGSIGEIIPIGSLLFEQHLDNYVGAADRKIDLLCFDTMFRDANLWESFNSEHFTTWQWLIDFASNHRHLNISISVRKYRPPPSEIVQKLKEASIDIIYSDTSYSLVERAKVFTTFYSTIGFELLGEGHEVIFMNPARNRVYLPVSLEFDPHQVHSYQDFESRVLTLLRSERHVSKVPNNDQHYAASSSRNAATKIINRLSM